MRGLAGVVAALVAAVACASSDEQGPQGPGQVAPGWAPVRPREHGICFEGAVLQGNDLCMLFCDAAGVLFLRPPNLLDGAHALATDLESQHLPRGDGLRGAEVDEQLKLPCLLAQVVMQTDPFSSKNAHAYNCEVGCEGAPPACLALPCDRPSDDRTIAWPVTVTLDADHPYRQGTCRRSGKATCERKTRFDTANHQPLLHQPATQRSALVRASARR